MKKTIQKQLQKVDKNYNALKELKYCVDSFEYVEQVVKRVFEFARRYGATI